ncbi:MAG TPA: efflux RND transporter permease subunit [Steroidobacteraceae bacterium]
MTGRGVYSWCMAHPIGTVLLAMALVLLGALAFPQLAVAPLPAADFPTIQISANLPGASAETMASSVATPLEVQFSSVPGVTQMTSTSALGSVSVTLQFELDKDINTAVQEVQAAINTASARLPKDMPSLPTWRKVNPTDTPVLMLSLTSDTLPLTTLSDYAETLLVRQLSQIDGVGQVNIIGQQRPAIRIKASPQTLAAAGLTLADIRGAVQRASVNMPKGALYGQSRVSTLEANDQLFDPRDYGDLIVTYRDGAPVYLKDVASVQFGAENDYVRAFPMGKSGVQVNVQREPGANIVATGDRLLKALPALREALPATVDLQVFNDRTRTIRASLHEVEITLLIAVVLVIGVMALFLRQLSATLIVTAVLGVTLVSVCAAMYLAGFTLNNLTLVAIVISVGFIVDDAIVVVENIHRHLEAGDGMREAALKGVSEIGFTVLSIGISLIAAFIPLTFMGGFVGRLFREFALTATAAIVISALVSLTLAPTLAAIFMKAPKHHDRSGHGFAARLLASYDRGLQWALAHQRTMLGIFALTVTLSAASFVLIAKGFFPLQDIGFIQGSTQARADVSFDEMVEKHRQIEQIIGADPAVIAHSNSVGATAGNQVTASGRIWLILSDPADRDASASEVIDRLRPKLAAIPGIQVFMKAQQDINLTANSPRAQYLYVLRSQNSDELNEWTQRLTERLKQTPLYTDVSNDLLLGASVTRLNIDRTAAARLGLSASDIDNALYDAFGQRQINEYQTQTNQYKVILELNNGQRGNAGSLAYFQLRSPTTGEMVPLSAIATIAPPSTGPLSIGHDGMQPAAIVSFNLARGVALGDAVNKLNALKAEIGVPSSVSGTFQGAAQAFEQSLASQPLLILSALMAVYIILGVLYESFVHPLTILSTLPSAGTGAILFLWLCGLDFSIMALIGVILLIGIVKKNGILLIDFALDAQRQRGLSPQAAIHEACLTRFRPIIMTTLAALFGAVPLMLGFGTGAELRQPLGIAIVGGLILSQLLTLFTTPVIYLSLDRLFHRRRDAAALRIAADRAAG